MEIALLALGVALVVYGIMAWHIVATEVRYRRAARRRLRELRLLRGDVKAETRHILKGW